MNRFCRSLILAVFGSITFIAQAAYPDRPVRLIVPYPPGGNIDATARIVAEALSGVLGQSVVVDNRAGASGAIGAEAVARAAPDGYTLLLASTGALAPVKVNNPTLKIDPEKDLISVGSIARAPLLLVVRADLPVHDLAGLIAYAKQQPGKLTMASAGIGGTGHQAGEMFQTMSGTKFLHVPYKGSSAAIADLLGGRVDLTFDQPASTLVHINSGKLRAIGVTTAERSPLMPDLPTLAESGLPGYDASTTTGLMLPAGTPEPVIARLNAALAQMLKSNETKRRFGLLGSDVMDGSRDSFSRALHDEILKWTEVAAHNAAPN